MKKIAAAAILALSALSSGALAQTSISFGNTNVRPESMGAAPDGTLYIGATAETKVYRVRPGQAPETFIDLRSTGLILGVLADQPSNTLWVCHMASMDRSTPLLKGKGILRSFDLDSGAPKLNLPLPEETSLCNDFVVGPDKALYVADTSNGKILRLRPGSSSLETVVQAASLYGVDGITFVGDTLYVNTIWSAGLYRIPGALDAKAGTPVQLQTPRLLKAPDGMRAQNGVIYLSEAGNGTVSALTIKDDVVTITPIRTGLTDSCAVAPNGKTLWVVERAANRVTPIALP